MDDLHKDLIALAVIVALGCGVVYSVTCPPHSEEYNSGYKAGYTEHNETKYNAAVYTFKTAVSLKEIVMAPSERDYAAGYANGYVQYKKEENIRVLKGSE